MDYSKALMSISDAIGVRLYYSQSRGLIGDREGVINLPNVGKVQVKIEVSSYFFSEQCGVIFKVRGKLFILLGYNTVSGILSMHIINSSKMVEKGKIIPPNSWVEENWSLRDACDRLKKAIVVSFVWKGTAWDVFKLP